MTYLHGLAGINNEMNREVFFGREDFEKQPV
jgi:hypothetical protein